VNEPFKGSFKPGRVRVLYTIVFASAKTGSCASAAQASFLSQRASATLYKGASECIDRDIHSEEGWTTPLDPYAANSLMFARNLLCIALEMPLSLEGRELGQGSREFVQVLATISAQRRNLGIVSVFMGRGA
jgi:hypothetical protein